MALATKFALTGHLIIANKQGGDFVDALRRLHGFPNPPDFLSPNSVAEITGGLVEENVPKLV